MNSLQIQQLRRVECRPEKLIVGGRVQARWSMQAVIPGRDRRLNVRRGETGTVIEDTGMDAVRVRLDRGGFETGYRCPCDWVPV